MENYMTKSEVRCATLLDNLLNKKICVDEILEKIKSFEQLIIRPGVGKIEFTIYVIDFVHSKTAQFINISDKTEPIINNAFNVPEVESSMAEKIVPKTSTSKNKLSNQEKKTVQIHTLSSKTQNFKLNSTSMNEQKSLDILGSLYATIINSNILCNLFHELGYVFTLLSIKKPETKSNNDSFNSNTIYFKSPEDCHYFASKTIQHLSSILIYLEKPIINLILKRKPINLYVPEFAKMLECAYNSTNVNDDIKFINSSITKDKVKFDEEQDTKDCFPTLKMFHAFKSQRDAFYDLLEDWKQNQLQLNPNKLATVSKLLTENNGAINMTKFTKLFVGLLLNSSFEDSKLDYKNKTIQDLSTLKLELLHQRITKRDYSSGHSFDSANEFTGVQSFFREFIILFLNNGNFCKHLIDTLVHRIDVLNTMEWALDLEGTMYQQTYFFNVDSLRLLAKFLAFTIYYPYKDSNILNPSLKDYLWEVRSKVLPPLNLLDKLNLASKQGHNAIILTISWIIEYMYQVDIISITTPFYQNVLTMLYSICINNSITTGSILMLKLQFNCLIEYINVAPHILFDNSTNCVDQSFIGNIFKDIKSDLLINTKQIYHYCPQLNTYRNILECKVDNKKLKFISPVLSSPIRKVKQNQLVELELESNFFENHSSSVLITVDFVAKRIASSCTKKIQTKGMAAVKNHFIDIVCVKFKEYVDNQKVLEFHIDGTDIEKCNVFMNSTIQQYMDNFSKINIPNSLKELLDSNIISPNSLPFCNAVTIRKFKELVTEWVKNHINIKNTFVNYISTELKQNLKNGEINEDGSNLHKLLMSSHVDNEPDTDLFIPDNKLLLDLNILSLKIIEADEYKLTPNDLFEYAEIFKIILENKNKMNSSLYRFIIVRLIDNVLLTTFHKPMLINSNVMKAYHPYLNEMLHKVSLIICERNIYILSEKCYSEKIIISEKITAWIQYFIENDFLTMDELTNQIMAILKLSWPEDTLKCLSICFKDLNDVCSKKFDDTKVQELFMWLTNFMDVIEDYDTEF
ncbi:Codanin-1, C-terminal domain [Cinara cedri]|uniref:Codanin-1, C-terminal domain n=1 Tax=Cinara cedri TaxID=506608 RepID=A0A5E4N424_9HEMI|nr:Codanin-1, C-terminal domain [Cinara cedri]